MARVTTDWRGVVILLDNAETQQLVAALEPLAMGGASQDASKAGIVAALGALGVAAAPAAIVAAAMVIALAVEIAWIKDRNKGNGVILTCPWIPAFVAVHTRTPEQIDPNWVANQQGTFVSPGDDRVDYVIDHGVESADGVVFRMINQTPSGWDKIFVLKDGEGNRWEVVSRRGMPGQEGLWAHQVNNNQDMQFRKPSFLGGWIDAFVLPPGSLAGLQGGDRVTFTWVKDS